MFTTVRVQSIVYLLVFFFCLIGYLDCPQLASPAVGTLNTTSLIFGTEVLLECSYGYTAIGVKRTLCKLGGVWSPMLDAVCRQGMSCVTTFEIMGL